MPDFKLQVHNSLWKKSTSDPLPLSVLLLQQAPTNQGAEAREAVLHQEEAETRERQERDKKKWQEWDSD